MCAKAGFEVSVEEPFERFPFTGGSPCSGTLPCCSHPRPNQLDGFELDVERLLNNEMDPIDVGRREEGPWVLLAAVSGPIFPSPWCPGEEMGARYAEHPS